MHRRLAIALLLAVALVAVAAMTGCELIVRKGIEQATGVKVDEQNGKVSIETKDGSLSSSEGKLPDGFPEDVPVYEGAKIVNGVSMGDAQNTSYMVTLGTDDEPKAVLDWYKSEVVKSGWKVENAVETPGAMMVQAFQDTRVLNVVAAPDSGNNGATGIQITVAPKSK